MTSWAAVVGVQEELEAAIKHRQEVFEAADVDDSGYLEIDEIDSVCRELGKKLSEEKLNSAMDEMDKDQSGEVSLKEFERWWRKELALKEERDDARERGEFVPDSSSEEEEDEEEVARQKRQQKKMEREEAKAAAKAAAKEEAAANGSGKGKDSMVRAPHSRSTFSAPWPSLAPQPQFWRLAQLNLVRLAVVCFETPPNQRHVRSGRRRGVCGVHR